MSSVVLKLISILLLPFTILILPLMKKEEAALKEFGVGELVNVGKCAINIFAEGNKENSKHTIVFMSGHGYLDTVVAMRPTSKLLAEKNRVLLVDRAGYGMSDDTYGERTVENIVAEYRTALQACGEKAPYVLMPHDISGMYAVYWQQQYPDEIESIIFLDATLSEYYIDRFSRQLVTEFSFIYTLIFIAGKTGLLHIDYFFNFLIAHGIPQPDGSSGVYTEKELEMIKLLWKRNGVITASCILETESILRNAKKCLEQPVYSDIPKLYISAGESGMPDDTIVKYGNVKITTQAGGHCLYYYIPNQLAAVINKFLDGLPERTKESNQHSAPLLVVE